MEPHTQGTLHHRRRRRLAGAGRASLYGYAPLVVAGVLIAGVVAVFPSRAPEQAVAADVEEVEQGRPATGWNDTVTACADGGSQVEGDPYSPPCFEFEGDNGGATTKGVTADEIVVSYRMTPEPNTLTLLAGLMGVEFHETSDDFLRTMHGLVDYFNENFEFYGRRIRLEPFMGTGTLTGELTGGGQEAAANDGIKAGLELGAFADITAITQPYGEAIAKQGTIAFGPPYMSREWFVERRPYAWSLSSDCSEVAEAASSYGLARLHGQPAVYAEGRMKGQERKLAIISPNNPQYQQCTAAGLAVLRDAGIDVENDMFVTSYALDLARVPNQAASISAQMVQAGVTTISCFCDPFMVLNLTQQFASQGLDPEWIVTGVGFTDLDLIGQGLADKNDQWKRSFGLSPLAELEPFGSSAAYEAYRSVRADEPSKAVDLLFYQLYQLALGIQMAGPNLTPETLETGLFSYPMTSGPAGSWDYSPEHYTPIVDYREVWFDTEMISPFNGERGAYRSDGERYTPEQLPQGQPEAPEEMGR